MYLDVENWLQYVKSSKNRSKTSFYESPAIKSWELTKDINQLGPYFFWLLPRTIHSPLLRAVELSSFPLEYYYVVLYISQTFYDKSYQHIYNSFLYNQGIYKVFNVLLYFDGITYGKAEGRRNDSCCSLFLVFEL